MEAMILLDPPHLSKGTSQLAAPDIKKALEILLSTATLMATVTTTTTATAFIQFDHRASSNNIKDNQENVAIVSDLYRAIILASVLLLEMCPWENVQAPVHVAVLETIHVDASASESSPLVLSLSTDQIQSLYETITQSILLLQRLGHFSYLTTLTSFHDWHDDLLPRSHHPLLQECFQRKPMVDLEEDIVFGMEQRLVSLEIEDYILQLREQEEWFANGSAQDQAQEQYGQENCNHGHEFEEKSFAPDTSSSVSSSFKTDDMEGIHLSFHPKQLAREENELLDIAFPDTQHTGRDGKTRKLDSAVAKHCIPSLKLTDQLQENDLLHYITIPFYGPCCIQKEGRLMMQRKSSSSDDQKETCHVILFANGAMYLQWQGKSDDDNGFKSRFKMFLLSGETQCHAQPKDFIFHFAMDHLTCVSSNCSAHAYGEESLSLEHTLVLAVDVDEGGSLMEGYRWMTEIAECAKFLSSIDQVKISISEKIWSAS